MAPVLAKSEQVAGARSTIACLTQQHLTAFPVPVRRVASPDPVDRAHLTAAALLHAQSGLRWYQWRRRREARLYAQQLAAYWIAEMEYQAHQRAAVVQAGYDEEWRLLGLGGHDVVAAQLSQAFQHLGQGVMATAVDADEAILVVDVPGEEALPEKMPGVTDAGNPSLRKMTKQQRADLYRDTVASFGLAVAGRAFAAAPTLQRVSVTAVRAVSEGATEPLVQARIDRDDYYDDSRDWRRMGAWRALHAVSREVRATTVGTVDTLVALPA